MRVFFLISSKFILEIQESHPTDLMLETFKLGTFVSEMVKFDGLQEEGEKVYFLKERRKDKANLLLFDKH